MTTMRQQVMSDPDTAQMHHDAQTRYRAGLEKVITAIDEIINADKESVAATGNADDEQIESVIQYNAQVIVIDIVRHMIQRFYGRMGDPSEVTAYMIACSKHATDDYADYMKTREEMQ